MISIVLPAYNAADFISDAIRSVLNQTNPDWELVIVDDGSSDKTLEIAKDFEQRDVRIKVFTQENEGPSAARKKGVENSTGEWITFLDSDDLLFPNAVEIFYKEITQPQFDIIIFSIKGWHYKQVILNKEDFISATIHDEYNLGPVSKLFKRYLFNENVFSISNTIRSGEDAIMNLRIAFQLKNQVKLNPHIIYEIRQDVNPSSLMKSFYYGDKYKYIYSQAFINSFPVTENKKYYPDIARFLAGGLYTQWRKKWKLTSEDKESYFYTTFFKYYNQCSINLPLHVYLNIKLENPMLRFLFDMEERGRGVLKRWLLPSKHKYYKTKP